MNRHRGFESREKKQKAFRVNLFLWLTISILLFVVNAITYAGHWWAFYPFLGWGLSVVFQAMELKGWMGGEFEQRRRPPRRRRREMERGGYLPEPDSDRMDLKDLDSVERKEKKWDDKDLV